MTTTLSDPAWEIYNAQAEVEPAMERYNPPRFKREFTVFRLAHFADRVVELKGKVELPTGSIIHVLDDVTHPEQHSDVPRIEEHPLIMKESFKRYIYHVRNFDLEGPIHVEDKFIYRPAGLVTSLLQFRGTYGGRFRYADTLESLPTKNEVL